MVNNRPYGMVLTYGSDVKWGWHEKGDSAADKARNALGDARLRCIKRMRNTWAPLSLPSMGRSPLSGLAVTSVGYCLVCQVIRFSVHRQL